MHLSQFTVFVLAAASAANAVPITASELMARGGPANVLAPGEMLLVNGDKLEIHNETTKLEFLKAQGILLEAPEIDYAWLNFTPPDLPPKTDKLSARDCAFTTAVVVDSTTTFLDWDVQMGRVVKGAGEGINAYVGAGWSVANSVSGSAGLDIGIVKNYLGLNFGVDYSRTWTTTNSDQYSTLVKAGKAGVWVTQPWTTRKYGRTLQGCPGSFRQVGTWMADAHEDGSYGNSKWVSGFITACIKPAPTGEQRMTRCHGQGAFK
ncbi:hypothetical protein CCHL11_06935 [Colletotrichum chlorophyti]|uniref:Uncharacterized protein n=1 Tax=Colletotrichum chlorophyti TaxID=708187 RepID=A0A1Q8RBZ6_9PEZI|nr:hypothetical protein CCHL11_06935 [Colletotrichum chlorophyti]